MCQRLGVAQKDRAPHFLPLSSLDRDCQWGAEVAGSSPAVRVVLLFFQRRGGRAVDCTRLIIGQRLWRSPSTSDSMRSWVQIPPSPSKYFQRSEPNVGFFPISGCYQNSEQTGTKTREKLRKLLREHKHLKGMSFGTCTEETANNFCLTHCNRFSKTRDPLQLLE